MKITYFSSTYLVLEVPWCGDPFACLVISNIDVIKMWNKALVFGNWIFNFQLIFMY